ncbi:hypothetical protein [Fervidibacillus albus]|uniref:Uncharacterized protein n=1 Tax=Fervidibacillus albus TaxID=2980026 RepID=A0A9E8LTZ6_9BACI|nr:hypothetical protein [Fervidibacillus albus]WAA09146.1 hypothetical protein OE104_11190 [Fervidibacillus albus]
MCRYLKSASTAQLKLIVLNRTEDFIELFCASLIYLYGGFKVIEGHLSVGSIIAYSSLLIYSQPA